MTRSLPGRVSLREETLIGGWRATCFIGWLEWPAWLAAELLHPRNHETSKIRSLSGTARLCGTKTPTVEGPRVNPGHESKLYLLKEA